MPSPHITVIAFSLALATTLASAQAPDSLSFQGRLTDSGGNPINATGQGMTFALYKGATKVWQEAQSVDVVNGIFNVYLGKVTPLDTVRFNRRIDLGIKVGADPEMTPRTPLAAAAYARALPGLYTFYFDDLAGNKGYNVIGGDPSNTIGAGVTGATIGGGGGRSQSWGANVKNRALANFSTIGGGGANDAGDEFSTIGGGHSNATSQPYAVVAGGSDNQADGLASAIGGGIGNKTTAELATVSGGYFNTASGPTSTVSGGEANTARGQYSTVPGGLLNRAEGQNAFAAGYNARARHGGTFVWNDRSITSGNDSLVSTNTNQFIVRARNGVGINRTPGGHGIHLKQPGPASSDGIRLEYDSDTDYWETYIDGADDYNFGYNGTLKSYIKDTDGVFTVFSDARLKDDVQPFGGVLPNVLQLRPATYRFKSAPTSSRRSVGFIAQEVGPLFPELVDEKDGLLALDYAGFGVIAIKAIQELYAELQSLREQVTNQQGEVDRLKAVTGH